MLFITLVELKVLSAHMELMELKVLSAPHPPSRCGICAL